MEHRDRLLWPLIVIAMCAPICPYGRLRNSLRVTTNMLLRHYLRVLCLRRIPKQLPSVFLLTLPYKSTHHWTENAVQYLLHHIMPKWFILVSCNLRERARVFWSCGARVSMAFLISRESDYCQFGGTVTHWERFHTDDQICATNPRSILHNKDAINTGYNKQ